MVIPAFAEEQSNPTLAIVNIDIDYNDFNIPAREEVVVQFDEIHDVSWQVNLVNDLLYGNPDGNGVIKFYDATIEDKFIEIGMGSPPDKKFWIAVQLPDEGYVVVHDKLDRGWLPGGKVILSYSDTAGLTVNNGERIVLSGDPKEGPLHMLPFAVVGCLGVGIVILLVTKKRS